MDSEHFNFNLGKVLKFAQSLEAKKTFEMLNCSRDAFVECNEAQNVCHIHSDEY